MERKNPKNKPFNTNNYKDGGLKDVDIFAKVSSLQCSWIKRLFDENFHQWKIIPACLIKKNFCKNFKFHPCLEPSIRSMKNVPSFYKEVIKNWAIYFSCSRYLPSAILPQLLWLDSNIKIDKKSIFISAFASKNINFVGQIFHGNGKTKSWDFTNSEYSLESKLKYRRIQLIDALPKL